MAWKKCQSLPGTRYIQNSRDRLYDDDNSLLLVAKQAQQLKLLQRCMWGANSHSLFVSLFSQGWMVELVLICNHKASCWKCRAHVTTQLSWKRGLREVQGLKREVVEGGFFSWTWPRPLRKERWELCTNHAFCCHTALKCYSTTHSFL